MVLEMYHKVDKFIVFEVCMKHQCVLFLVNGIHLQWQHLMKQMQNIKTASLSSVAAAAASLLKTDFCSPSSQSTCNVSKKKRSTHQKLKQYTRKYC